MSRLESNLNHVVFQEKRKKLLSDTSLMLGITVFPKQLTHLWVR